MMKKSNKILQRALQKRPTYGNMGLLQMSRLPEGASL